MAMVVLDAMFVKMNGNAPHMDSTQLLSIAETKNPSKKGSKRTIPRSKRNSNRRAKLGDKLTNSNVEPGQDVEHTCAEDVHEHGDLSGKTFAPK